MRLLRKVKPIEIKRSFAVSDFVRHHEYETKGMTPLSKRGYATEVRRAKAVVTKIPEGLLDQMLKGTTEKRFMAYRKLQWHMGIVDIDEVRVWTGAGGLPKKWTRGSLKETADFVRKALKKNPRTLGHRAQSAIPGILSTSLSTIQTEKYLWPIIIPFHTLDKSGHTRMKGDIDDGCMRSIALAVSGRKKIKAYIGVLKKK